MKSCTKISMKLHNIDTLAVGLNTARKDDKMTIKEWNELKHGDQIKHENGDVETIYVWDGKQYIEGEKCLYPLEEFDHKEWTKL